MLTCSLLLRDNPAPAGSCCNSLHHTAHCFKLTLPLQPPSSHHISRNDTRTTLLHHTSYIIYHISYIIHHTSHIIHHTSYIIHRTSYIIQTYKKSMLELVSQLESKEPFYVRCIKPNEKKSPTEFDDEMCLHQVKYETPTHPPSPTPSPLLSE